MLPRHQRDLITMPTTVTPDDNIIGVGQQVLHSLRQSLTRDLGENAAVYLQEAGFAAGKQVYDSFLSWRPNIMPKPKQTMKLRQVHLILGILWTSNTMRKRKKLSKLRSMQMTLKWL